MFTSVDSWHPQLKKWTLSQDTDKSHTQIDFLLIVSHQSTTPPQAYRINPNFLDEQRPNSIYSLLHQFSSVQSLSRVWLFATPWIAARQASLSITNSRSLPNSHPSTQWCHPAISSSAVPFSSCPQSLPASESFPMSQLFTWGGQSTGVSALASFVPKKSQGWSPLEWIG